MNIQALKRFIGFVLTLIATSIGFGTATEMAANITVLFAAVYATMELIKSWKMFSKDVLQIISWILGPFFAISLWFLELGILEGHSFFVALGVGIAASVSAVFIYTTEWLQAFLINFLPWIKLQYNNILPKKRK